jgi:dUTP pyrophosphatase
LKSKVEIGIVILRTDAKIPTQKHDTDAGYDVYAPTEGYIRFGKVLVLYTGFALDIPRGYFFDVRPRGGLARDHGIQVVNTPGTIDADFRGEVQIFLTSINERLNYHFEKGERIAQLLLREVVPVKFNIMRKSLYDKITERRDRGGGFGSTGKY